MSVAFRQGGRPTTALLRTKFDRVEFFISQTFESSWDDDHADTLRFVEYKYTLTPRGDDQPILRWEYVSEYPDDVARWCKYHLQGPIPLQLGRRGEARLNDFHLPTGHVALEDVLRFCIVDLGVRPLGRDWHETLLRSQASSSER